LLGGGGLLGLGLVLLLVFLFWPASGAASADMAYMPDNAEGLVSIRVADLLNSPIFQKLSNNAQGNGMFGMPAQANDINKAREITSMLIGIPRLQAAIKPVVVARTSVDYTPETMLQSMKRSMPPTLNIGEQTVYRLGEQSFCLLDKRRILIGPEEALQTILTRKKQPVLSSKLQDALNKASLSHTVVLVMDMTRQPQMPMRGFPGGGTSPEAITVAVDLNADISATVQAHFKDANSASNFRQGMDQSLAMLKNMPNALGQAQNILNNLNLSSDGATVTASVRIDEHSLPPGMGGGMGNPLGGWMAGGNPFKGLPFAGGNGNPPVNNPPPVAQVNNPPMEPVVNPPVVPGNNPVVPPGNQAAETKTGPGSWSVSLQPNQSQSYNVTCKGNLHAELRVFSSSKSPVSVAVYDATGRLLGSDMVQGRSGKVEWDPVAPGLYRVEVRNQSGELARPRILFSERPPAGGVKLPPAAGGNIVDLNRNDVLPSGGQNTYAVQLTAGTPYTIDMTSTEFDTYLILYDAAGREVTRNDDGVGLNARIVYVPAQTGVYRIEARSFGSGRGGNYLLTVRH
jgi:hypothetical protein